MTHSAGRPARNPTVLAVSRYGAFWLLDARSGAVRWRLVNGCHSAAIDHGGEKLYVTYVSAATVRRDTRKPIVRTAKLQQLSPEELRQYHELLVSPAELLALRAEDGAATWRMEGWVRRWNQPRSHLYVGQRLDGDLVLTDVTAAASGIRVIAEQRQLSDRVD
jgi:hypothetical protein